MSVPPLSFDAFLRDIGRRAVFMAELATRNREDALDIVQDSMLTLSDQYAKQAPEEWGPLFHTILQRKLTDWHRRSQRRHRWFVWLNPPEDDPEADPLAEVPEVISSDPALLLERARDMETLQAALVDLPLRQQQAFLLRVWEGLDTEQTASAMACSEGSVKTHLSRAMQVLRTRLEHPNENH